MAIHCEYGNLEFVLTAIASFLKYNEQNRTLRGVRSKRRALYVKLLLKIEIYAKHEATIKFVQIINVWG